MKRILLLLVIPLLANSDTTGNLITNGTFDNGTTGWTLSGDAQRIGDCCPGGHDLEFGDFGSIEQSFNLIDDSVTQSMLDNGITLDSTVEVQNGEGGVGSWAPNRGGADTFTIRLQIQDEDQNVLATTTQERTNVTGINGKDFSDSVTYTGTGSNIGNIYISGSDANAPANLGGPNVDNISVTMTYDPVVLTTEQTLEIANVFTSVSELEEEVAIIEFIPIEELTFTEYTEPEIEPISFIEFVMEEFAQEEISVGIVNIFEEITYEEPETIESFATEVESFEEIVEESESTNIEGAIETVQSGEESGGVEENQSVAGNTEPEERSTGTEETESSETRTAEADTETDRNVGSGEEVVAENNVGEVVPDVSIDNIRQQVEQTTQSVDAQLTTVQTIVANAMQNNTILDAYSSKQYNDNYELASINIDEYILQDYTDNRQIYSDSTNIPVDSMVEFESRVSEALSKRIRAEEHLRRIRGY